MFSVLWSDPSLYNEKTTIIVSQSKIMSSVVSSKSASSYSETLINPLPGYD
jgi:hypothetical protein